MKNDERKIWESGNAPATKGDMRASCADVKAALAAFEKNISKALIRSNLATIIVILLMTILIILVESLPR